jgi:Kef-type K+ transport system membrane component KefB
MDADRLLNRARAVAAISFSGILVPLLLGGFLGMGLYRALAPSGVDRMVFGAFFAVAMSVTAFPVLARIVAERRLDRTELGVVALSCAAVDDATAWCLLAIVASLASARGSGLSTLGLTAAYVALMLRFVRPLVQRLVRSEESPSRRANIAVPGVFLLLLASALVTEWIGIHALFGAFLFGTLIPESGGLARRLSGKLGGLVKVFLLPVFFASSGLRTEVALLGDGRAWLLCALIVLVAFIGKLGGVFVTARLLGMEGRQAAALGVLMNTRGLMELIVLNVGLDFGIISSSLFTMMVLMALTTTMAAGPLLDWIGPRETVDIEAAESQAG